MFLPNEDIERLMRVKLEIAILLKHAITSDLEEAHERDFAKKIDGLNFKSAFYKIQKELKRMPNKFREIFNEEWFKKHLRQKSSGVYELRCSMGGVPISGAGKTPDIAAENFIKNLLRLNSGQKEKAAEKKILFNDFAEKWFKLVKKPTVKTVTYNSYLIDYNAHLKPYFKNAAIADITAMKIQPLFNNANRNGSRSSAKLKVLLNQIFAAAVAERLIPFNPMASVKVLKHQNKHGVALTYSEEREFLQKLEGSQYKLTFALLLFCGMRRGELCSAKLEGDFITVLDGKKKIEQLPTVRKIPITPMLAPYLAGIAKREFKAAISFSGDVLSRAFKRLCPAHHLHELRHTFITRCQECGVPREVVSVWAGHAADSTMTSTVYTHFSDEFLLEESKKVDYNERLI